MPGRDEKVRPTLPPALPAFDSAAFFAGLKAGKSVRDYRAKQAIFAQGDAADAVFYVRTGRVKLTVVSGRGKEAVIAILDRKAFFGEGCLAAQPLRMSTASAVEASSIIRVEKKTMIGLLHRAPEFAAMFTAYLLSRNVRIEEDLVDQLFNSSEKRLARLLLLLAHFGKESRAEVVIPKIGQDTLAAMIGTTRSRVSFFMNRFRKLGFIKYNGSIEINSSLINVILHD